MRSMVPVHLQYIMCVSYLLVHFIQSLKHWIHRSSECLVSQRSNQLPVSVAVPTPNIVACTYLPGRYDTYTCVIGLPTYLHMYTKTFNKYTNSYFMRVPVDIHSIKNKVGKKNVFPMVKNPNGSLGWVSNGVLSGSPKPCKLR